MILTDDLCSILGESVMPLCSLKRDRNYSKSKELFYQYRQLVSDTSDSRY